MAVTRDDVMRIAALARLAIHEERVGELVAQLNGILGHMEVLREVDVSGAPRDGATEAGTPLRADAVAPIPLARPLESFAPEMRDGFFLVPRLATHEDEEVE